MAYAGIQMFMEKLNQLINCNDNPLINIPSIIHEKPQFQLLYEELGSMTQTLFVDEHQDLHELEKVNDLKKRFIDAAEEAQYIMDMFLSNVYFRINYLPYRSDVRRFKSGLKDLNPSLNLDDVRRSFKSIKMEFMSMRINSMKMDSSRRSAAAPQIPRNRNSLGKKKLMDEIFVGLDLDAETIIEKLVAEYPKKVDVVSIVGMGGIGKTTLATKVFNDGYVKYHFHVRLWVTVSQTYDKRDVLVQILESIRSQLDLEKASDFQLHEIVHRHLMDQRYLIVIDDIWHTETWDNLKLCFPHGNKGSRILLTSRITEVAKHANSNGLIHHLGCLNKEKGLELLCKKVFHDNEFPEWSIKQGMQIVENCKGLPLALVVIAGVLAKEASSEKFWVEIAERTSLYIVDEENGCLKTLALSYYHLPFHLKECFLYLGGFPEDYKFKVQWLIWLWVAEGFIQEDGNRSLEDIAEGYLMDLIDRSLVTVAHRSRSSGSVKGCKVHDLVREVCLGKAKEEQFILQTERLQLSAHFSTPSYKPVRMFMNEDISFDDLHSPADLNIRSILCFWDFGSVSRYANNFILLRVLDLQKCILRYFPDDIEFLVHLRYLAIHNPSADFPHSICGLLSLQTLIYISDDNWILPSSISYLVNLRHLWSYVPYTRKSMKASFILRSIEKPMNLQTISDVVLEANVFKCFPYIKELRCKTNLDEENDFKSLTYLETLKLIGLPRIVTSIPKKLTFPVALKKLTLYLCNLLWSDMSIIQSLPNLEVLTLKHKAFEGSCWNTDEQEFPRLKFLRLEWLDIKLWKVYKKSFPCLKQLEIIWCHVLEEIPIEIGDIPTLELIKINSCSSSVGECARKIQQEQHELGNEDLKIDVSDDLPL